jgi:hypothetical protein
VRILVASTYALFARDAAADRIASELANAIRRRGHDVEAIEIPFAPDEQLEQQVAIRLLDVRREAARLICLGPPAHLIRHPDKRVWLIHDRLPLSAADAALTEATRVLAADPALAQRLNAPLLPRPAEEGEWDATAEALAA